MVTLADVGRIAGVSTATVSHVLNQTRYVSDETKERVYAALDETGYQLNPFARALRKDTSDLVGFVVSDLANPYSMEIMKGIEAGTRASHRTLVVANTDDDPQLELDSFEAFGRNRVAGLITALSAESSPKSLDYLKKAEFPVVLVDTPTTEPFDQVIVNGRDPSRTVVEHLIELGHSRIAVMAGQESNANNRERVAGWTNAMQAHGLNCSASLIHYSGRDTQRTRDQARELLTSAEPPTAIFATSNRVAEGLLETVGELGLRMPDDLSVVVFDEPPFANLIQPRLTCIAQPTLEIGTEAVRLMMERITDRDLPPNRVVLEPTIQHGGSCCHGPF